VRLWSGDPEPAPDLMGVLLRDIIRALLRRS
jgi:hypothetical protein